MPLLSAYILPHPPVIIPEVGRGREQEVRSTLAAFHTVAAEIAALEPDGIILVSPHAPSERETFLVSTGPEQVESFAAFGAAKPRVRWLPDNQLAEVIWQQADAAGLPIRQISLAAPGQQMLDHGTLVPLTYIARALDQSARSASELSLAIPVVRLSFANLSPQAHQLFGEAISRAIQRSDRRVVFIASGDLSHRLLESGPYGYTPEGPAFDQRICDIIESGAVQDFVRPDPHFTEAAAECGLRSFQILSGVLQAAFPEGGWTARLLSYEGTFGVGYAVASFKPRVQTAEEDPRPALARRTLETYVRDGHLLELSPEELAALPPELTEQAAGVFVTLQQAGRLRGCIGTITPTCAIVAEEIMRNAIQAGTRDPRFAPVSERELATLEYSVDVLGAAEPIQDRQLLDVRRYGVIVSQGFKRGLLLPDLDGVDTVEAQLDIACRKAGINPQSDYQIERFEVIRYPGLPAGSAS